MLELGKIFADRYVPFNLDSTGGTAHLYQAFDKESSENVALKIFREGSLPPHSLREMWNRETTALQKLKHENVVEFRDAGRCQTTGLQYIALEWFDGKPLETILSSSEPMKFERFMDLYGWQMLDALCVAYQSSILHRDISPNNVLVSDNGQIKIIDFGQSRIGESTVGQTVAGFATPPYSPPEQDTGRYTETRDAFSFAAIAVRAVVGKEIKNSDELYDAVKEIDVAERSYSIITQALSRSPEKRPVNILEFADLFHTHDELPDGPDLFELNYRVVAGVDEQIGRMLGDEEHPGERLQEELEDTAAIGTLYDDKQGARFAVETRNLRLIADVDHQERSMIAFISAISRDMGFAQLWRPNMWHPEVRFVAKIPRTRAEKQSAQHNVLRFYEAMALAFAQMESERSTGGIQTWDAWRRLLDAMVEIERTRVAPLRYKTPEVAGSRLSVQVANPQDGEVDEARAITENGAQVFNGIIESISNGTCVLVSRYPRILADKIPISGKLEIDWNMARVAIKRQRDALTKFSDGEIANEKLAEIVRGAGGSEIEPEYEAGVRFFDKDLDADKKMVVAQFLATHDALLVHGPPGTGKTRVIVEMIKQYLTQDYTRRILLVAQTHVAVDHALTGILNDDKEIRAVRIGSGTRQVNESVKWCTVEERGKELRKLVERTSEKFLEDRAAEKGVDIGDVRLGIRVTDVQRCRTYKKELADQLSSLDKSRDNTDGPSEDEGNSNHLTTSERDAEEAKRLQAQADLMEVRQKLDTAEEELKLAETRLEEMGEVGKDLLELDAGSLQEWCNALLEGEHATALQQLIETSEEWRLKFGQSDDFKAAIVADSQIVAGTCVGFCAESAAASGEFDLCIVDEASKATTTELLVSLAQAKQVVLVGDHYQLPAIIDTALKSEDIISEYGLDEGQLDNQLFEVLQSSLPKGHCAQLTIQHRMHTHIGELISECFYEGELKNASSTDYEVDERLRHGNLYHAVTWRDTSTVPEGRRGEHKRGTTFANPAEAECILAQLRAIAFVEKNAGPLGKTIGVISGYSEQVATLRREIARDSVLSSLDVECNTVHQFQGREVDICIYSITRDNPKGSVGFLCDWRHLNVALSRAKEFLIVVGSVQFCRRAGPSFPLTSVLEFIENRWPDQIQEWSDVE